ncbi:MAG: arginine--tRNA ligase [Hydrotalea sp.]|nr:arginine--tRNA ligase [Hydrotalea sp.]
MTDSHNNKQVGGRLGDRMGGPNVFADIHHKIENIIRREYELVDGRALPPFQVERPKEESFGDLSCNAAMVLTKFLSNPPRAIAEKIIGELQKDKVVKSVSIAGPGFINIFLTDNYWQGLLAAIYDAGDNYGKNIDGANEKTNVEFVSANPTGPLHVGHARGAVVGDVLVRLLRFAGFDVTAEYYINDAGAQIDTLARSLYFRYQQSAGAVDKNLEPPAGCYPGDYLIPPAEDLYKEVGDKYAGQAEVAWLDFFRDYAVGKMMVEIKKDLADMHIAHDVFSSEKKLVAAGKVQEVLQELEKENKIYEGVLEKPKGKTVDDWEPRPQKLFRSTADGDEVDRPIQKSDGSFTYFANDIAYHLDKCQRGATRLINILGADHGGYVKRISSATRAVSHGRSRLECLLMQVVRFMQHGAPLKMSKRAGNFIMLRDVIAEVGADSLRIYLLSRRPDSQMDFDYDEVMATKRDNPVFYLHYGFARAHSLMKIIDGQFAGLAPDFSPGALAKINHPLELQMIKKIAEFPNMVEKAALLAEPHRIVFYLADLATCFHQLWTAGRDDLDLKFLQVDDRQLTAARLALVKGFCRVMEIAGRIMAIEWKTELR